MLLSEPSSYEVTKARNQKEGARGRQEGAPAGMQTARVAAMRGHEVTLFEKGPLPGRCPCRLPQWSRGLNSRTCRLLSGFSKPRLKSRGYAYHLSREFTPADIDKIKPDVVVLASGGTPTLPEVARNQRAQRDRKAPTCIGVLRFFIRFIGPKPLRASSPKSGCQSGKTSLSSAALIQGCQLGEFLTKRGRKVTIVDTEQELGGRCILKEKPVCFTGSGRKAFALIGGVKLEKIRLRNGLKYYYKRRRYTTPAGRSRSSLRCRWHRIWSL